MGDPLAAGELSSIRPITASVASIRVPWGIQTSITNWLRSAEGKNCCGTREKSPTPAANARSPIEAPATFLAMKTLIAHE